MKSKDALALEFAGKATYVMMNPEIHELYHEAAKMYDGDYMRIEYEMARSLSRRRLKKMLKEISEVEKFFVDAVAGYKYAKLINP